MIDPTFSVAMATYNGEPFLTGQLNSLTSQLRLPFELVVCDDASTDATIGILNSFAERAPFSVRIYENKRNVGYGENFLKAASLCRGDWIAFCDQDDVWSTEKLERCARVIEAHPEVVLVSHSADQVDDQLRPLSGRMPDHRAFEIRGPLQSSPLSVYPGFSCCVRRSLLQGVPVDDRPESIHRLSGRQSHDGLVYHLANTYGHIATIPESLALYRRHGYAFTGPGETKAYRAGIANKLENLDRDYVASFRSQAGYARAHQRFYEEVRAEAERTADDGVFIQRSQRAEAYYAYVASACMKRAEIHEGAGTILDRARVLIEAVRLGTYSGGEGGRGLGRGAFLHDLFRTLFPRRSPS